MSIVSDDGLVLSRQQVPKPKMTWFIDAHDICITISQWINVVEIGLTHWGRVTHICVSKLTIIVSDNGLSPGRRQAIIWTNDGILLIGPLGTNFSEILIKIHTFSFKKMHFKMLSGRWQPFCLGLNVLNHRLSSYKIVNIHFCSGTNIIGMANF